MVPAIQADVLLLLNSDFLPREGSQHFTNFPKFTFNHFMRKTSAETLPQRRFSASLWALMETGLNKTSLNRQIIIRGINLVTSGRLSGLFTRRTAWCWRQNTTQTKQGLWLNLYFIELNFTALADLICDKLIRERLCLTRHVNKYL